MTIVAATQCHHPHTTDDTRVHVVTLRCHRRGSRCRWGDLLSVTVCARGAVGPVVVVPPTSFTRLAREGPGGSAQWVGTTSRGPTGGRVPSWGNLITN